MMRGCVMIVDMSSTKSNISKIKEQFQRVIEHSQGYGANVDALFDKWLEAKRDFIECWRGQLVLEIPHKVTFELSQKDRDARLDDFINSVSTTFDNETLACFIEDNRAGFFDNRVVTPYENTYTGVEIKEGMKLIRAFKFFESDPFVLKDIQTQASMIIQEDKVEGTLCFSVHPLDFLSSSENTYKWRSCHALDGEYRAGNLSYMVDRTTIMCYLKGADNAKLPNFPEDILWNSKKWRMLVFFSENWDVIFAGRQYPFFSMNALNTIMHYMSDNKMCTGYWSEWHDDKLTSFNYKGTNRDGGGLMYPYICISNEIMNLYDIVKDEPNSLHFNDLLRSSCYNPFYCFKYYRPIGVVPKVRVGGRVPCVHCGNSHIVATDSMLCEDCELEFGDSSDDRFGYCDYCDRRISMDDGHWIHSHGQVLCDWCYDQYVITCAACGQDHFFDEVTYDKQLHGYVCPTCQDNRRKSYGCSTSVTEGGSYYYIFTEE